MGLGIDAIGLHEWLKNAVQPFRGNSDSSIGNREMDCDRIPCSFQASDCESDFALRGEL